MEKSRTDAAARDGLPVEEWARTARFEQPIRLGEVEAGVLSRRPIASAADWLIPVLGVVGWIALGLAWVLGAGAPILGLLLVWLGTRDPGGSDGWLAVARMVFVCAALAGAVILYGLRGERLRRDGLFALLGVPSILSCVAAFVLVRRSDVSDVPWGLLPGIVMTGIFTTGLTLVWALARRRPPRDKSKEPPLRGPRSTLEQARYIETRQKVLDILAQRGLLKLDEADRLRLRGMPLGYWEELDGVDERERRRIIEYRMLGWRTFTEADHRPWRRPRR